MLPLRFHPRNLNFSYQSTSPFCSSFCKHALGFGNEVLFEDSELWMRATSILLFQYTQQKRILGVLYQSCNSYVVANKKAFSHATGVDETLSRDSFDFESILNLISY